MERKKPLSSLHHREYVVWAAMRNRCYNVNNGSYRHYGGRGITVCERWRKSFENFFADMGERPARLTIERVDNDGNYDPSNCVWATYISQMELTNRRRAIDPENEREMWGIGNSGSSVGLGLSQAALLRTLLGVSYALVQKTEALVRRSTIVLSLHRH